MNSWIYLIIESVISCVLLTLLIVPRQIKDPVSQIASYPPPIRKRVQTLTEYSDMIKARTKKQVIIKITAAIAIAVVFGVITYYSGAKTFFQAFTHVFIWFTIVNLFDVVILDLCFFCHSKKVIIKGTEDMTDEYKNPKHHLVGGLKGIGIGAVVALISAFVVVILN